VERPVRGGASSATTNTKPTKYRMANLPVWTSKPRSRAIFMHQRCQSVGRICSGFRATLAQVLHLGLGAQRVRFRIGGFAGDQRRRVRGRQASLTCAKRLAALRARRSRPGTQNWPTPRCQGTMPMLLSLAHRAVRAAVMSAIRAMPSDAAEHIPRSSARASLLVGAACGLAFLLSVLPREAWIIDDALIYQNYVRSALQGRGLVYGPGMTAEGYSSPLWTVLLCMLGAIGLKGFGVAKILGALMGASAAALIGFFAARRLGWKPGLAVSLLLALSPAWAWWSASGMETPLFGLLFAAVAVACLSRHEVAAATATGLIGVGRPEGFIFVAALLMYFVLLSAKDGWSRRRTITVVTLCLAPLIAWSVFRLINYEALIANSAWAKLGGGAREVSKPALQGVAYVFESLKRLPGPWIVALVSTFATLRYAAREPSHMLVVALLYLLVLFSVFVGGDWMPWTRFIVPGVPLMLILGIAAWDEYQGNARALFGAVVGIALLLTAAQQFLEFNGYFTHHEISGHRLVPRWPSLRRPLIDPVKADPGAHFYAMQIARFTEPNDSVVHIDIGQSGYLASDIRVMDTFGLVSRFEAAFLNGRYTEAELRQHFTDLNPSLVFALADPATGEPSMRVVRPLADLLESNYESAASAMWWGQQVLHVMVRKDRLQSEPDAQRIERWLADSPGISFDSHRFTPGS